MVSSLEEKFSYIPLHLHSCYSINDGLQNVNAIVKRAAKLKIPALALTDFANVAGFIRFYNACLAAGIKPIMGADLQFQDPPVPGEEPLRYNLTLLAMNRRGKQNLYDILSEAWLQSGTGDINEVCSSLKSLARHAEGIIVLNGFQGDLAAFKKASKEQLLQARLKFYQEHFGDRFCLEITRTGRAGESEFERLALGLCLEYGIAPVASNDTRFLLGPEDVPEDGLSDYAVHDVRVSIQKGIRRGNKELAKIYSKEQYLRSPSEMRSLFADLPEALENTRTIAVRCNVKLELDHPRLPHYDTGELSTADFLRKAAHQGLAQRLNFLYPDEKERERQRPKYEARLETELKVIIDMDFAGYFLIVMEFIQWSKAHGVPVGPGRGSGGGSLVAYALTITDFDPLRFDLLFERFLNPERVSMPDFDVDFCQKKREFTLRHVVEHYGRNAVSQIAAFGTLAPKAAIQGVGRALGIPLGKARDIAGMVPEHPGVTFASLLSQPPSGSTNPDGSGKMDFATFFQNAKNNNEQDTVELISLAIRLEGVIRNIGKHAAGVVISPTRIAEFSPEMLDADGNPITQYDKKDVEHAGLVKFDFLGLTTLTIIDEALKMINARRARAKQPRLAVSDIPYEDPQSFATLQQGETTAVFQLEGAGMRKLIKQMHPDRFDDLIALVALYRPGPLESGMVEHFVLRKHGVEKVSYPQPDFQDLDLKPVLDSTYGVIVYQEQVMQLAQILAGYSLGGADILRRAMGKKIKSEMDAQRAVFLRGAEKKGKDPHVVMQIFNQVEKFAEYGFNKSHSAAYALVAWWTLWLKVHYPAEFLAAMMSADCLKTEKLLTYMADCHRLGITVCPPDINHGYFDFTVNKDGTSIIYGFAAIKGVGEKLMDRIVEEREHSGLFTDFFEFVNRTGTGFVTKLSLEALIKSGALDQLGPGRAAMLESIPAALKYAQKQQSDQNSGIMDLFAGMTASRPAYPSCEEWSRGQQLSFEKAVLGMYVSGHPADGFRGEFEHFCGGFTLACLQNGSPMPQGPFVMAGMVTSSVQRTTKISGQPYYILTLEDGTADFQLALFGEQAECYEAITKQREERQLEKIRLQKARGDREEVPPPPALILIIRGQFYTYKDGSVKFKPSAINTLEELRVQQARALNLILDSDSFRRHAAPLRQLLQSHGLHPQNAGPGPNAGPDNQITGRGPGIGRGPNRNGAPGPGNCALNLRIDNKVLHLYPRNLRLIPSDELICSLQELAGSQAVSVSY